MTVDYKTIFHLEIFSISDEKGKTVSARAHADGLNNADLLIIIQMISQQLTSLIQNHNKNAMKCEVTSLEEKFSNRPINGFENKDDTI